MFTDNIRKQATIIRDYVKAPEIPVCDDLIAIFRSLNCRIHFCEQNDNNGDMTDNIAFILEKFDDGGANIFVNPLWADNSRVFNLAVILGEILLIERIGPTKWESVGSRVFERSAICSRRQNMRQFAALFLMQDKSIFDIVNNNPHLNEDDIVSIVACQWFVPHDVAQMRVSMFFADVEAWQRLENVISEKQSDRSQFDMVVDNVAQI